MSLPDEYESSKSVNGKPSANGHHRNSSTVESGFQDAIIAKEDDDNQADQIKSVLQGSSQTQGIQSSNEHENVVPIPTGKEPLEIGTGVITGLIAAGSTSRVYKIWSKELEEFRVIKLFLPTDQKTLKKRFETEAKIAAKLRHPNIVSVFSVGVWEKLPYIEMEFIDGESLSALLKRVGRLPEKVASSIATSVARALSFAHTRDIVLYGKSYRGVIHRDLKPANIMISRDGHVKLSDFGVASPSKLSIHNTINDGLIVGTLHYFSPEQMEGKPLDARTDVYAFGAVLYEMLTGQKTFPQANITQIIKMKTLNQYKRLGDFNFEISQQMTDIVEKCLETDPLKRYKDGTELLEALQQARSKAPQGATEVVTRDFISSKISKLDEEEFIQPSPSKKSNVSRNMLFSAIGIGLILVAAITTGTIIGLKSKERAKKEIAAVQPNQTPSTADESSAFDSEMQEDISINSSDNTDAKLKKIRLIMDKRYFTQAITYLEDLKVQVPNNALVDLYLLESLFAVRESERAWNIAMRTDIDDANFDLIKGCLEHKRGNSEAALTLFATASTKNSIARNPDKIRKDALYYSAMVLNKIYDSTQSQADQRKAIQAWENVKREYESTPKNPRYTNAQNMLDKLLELIY